MGTSYTMGGHIAIEPPLNYAQIQEARRVAMELLRQGFDRKHATEDTVFDGYMPLKPELLEADVDTPEGVLHTVKAIALVPAHRDGSLTYGLRDLVWKLATHFNEHTFTGVVMALREDATKAYKLTVSGRDSVGTLKVEQTEGPTFVRWADSSEMTPISELID